MVYFVCVDTLVIYCGTSYADAVAAAVAGDSVGHPATVYMMHGGPVYVSVP